MAEVSLLPIVRSCKSKNAVRPFVAQEDLPGIYLLLIRRTMITVNQKPICFYDNLA